MRNKIIFVSFFLSSLAFGLEPSGYLRLEKRFPVFVDTLYFLDFYNELFFEIEESGGDNFSFKASIDARFYTFPDIGSLQELQEPEKNPPLDIFLWEAYIDIRRFPFNNIDLRIGKQRVSWGTADGLNPTDNINPDDFSDLLDFTKKMPTETFLATFYIKDFSLSAVWSPAVYPALLPKDISLFSFSEIIEDIYVSHIEDHLILPARNIKNGQMGIRLKGKLFTYDVSLSNFYGYEHFPFPTQITIYPDTLNPLNSKAEIFLELPKIPAIGADFAGDIGDFGVWGEAGIFFPEKILTKIISPLGKDSVEILSEEPYLKWTLGFDTFFWDGAYLNFQFAYGFPTEIGRDNLGNYFTGVFEKPFLSDRLNLRVYGVLEIRDFDRFKETSGNLVSTELSYLLNDNLEITLGILSLNGEKESLFGQWKEWDLGFVRIKASF
jgi:hypothetical protein